VNRYHGGIAAPLLCAAFALLFLSCSSDQGDVANPQQGLTAPVPGLSNVTIGDFTVTFTGRDYDGTATTFSYNVYGPACRLHFRLGWPVTECTSGPITWLPADGRTGISHCCINPGLEWRPVTPPGPYISLDFSYTFAGDIPEGITQACITKNGTVSLGDVAGPGIPMYTISGTVFQDANGSGTLDAGETYISNTAISLTQDNSLVSTTTSDASGNYSFSVPCGMYSVELDTTTLTGTQNVYFNATTPLTRDVSAGPDSPDNNFGFDVNVEKTIEDLDNGTLPTTGAEAKFWKKEYQFAAKGKDSFFTRDSLLLFLDRLEGLALATPFVFTGTETERLDAAYEILRKPIHTDFEAFERELLTIELNHVSGFGIDASTELVLIGWGETLYNEALSGANPKNGATMAATLPDATGVYEHVNANKSPGGGGSTR